MRSYDAFLLISFGGPEKREDVIPFLENVTRGRGIPRERLAEVGEHYYLFDGVSPINQQCRDLIAALRDDFAANGVELPIYWGNRNWDPYLEDTVAEMARNGVRRAVALATSAYSNYSSHRQYLEDIERARAAVPEAPEIDLIRPFYDHPGFIDAFVDHTRQALERIPEELRPETRLLYSAHSLPIAMAKKSGDPRRDYGSLTAYEAQLLETARLITERLDRDYPYEIVYQSRSGPPSQPWLEPDINDRLEQLAKEGVRSVVVVPHGFVSDHMEVKYDLDVEARETAEKLGIRLERAAAPGTHPAFVAMVRDLVAERAEGRPPRGLGAIERSCHDDPADCCQRS
ncbi:ferrochelatase [Thermobifida fusca]|jgi:protoporphyrin/coproporphyrin ferrochelatase|uniref:Coproporphyrin III ferrochelatase n=2 Tax=Thermobifida fusca TaxID=2021 RepID=A0A9P2TAS9_THEFU|nr:MULTISPECIES: ferrochelatase [Thermobifida]AAZ55978.1 ferrochelatase [Thermobifida fusca YX]EOR71024.1 ferrochelatase [Thermobifida fusca TM51]MBO2528375.1 ferrochelatase [Thermobifida sp.]PPS91957.1 ferrochelatase [Thermobifida fusca]PZN61339.1 MAG: ferrochelatase [Thermobifida fusca]